MGRRKIKPLSSFSGDLNHTQLGIEGDPSLPTQTASVPLSDDAFPLDTLLRTVLIPLLCSHAILCAVLQQSETTLFQIIIVSVHYALVSIYLRWSFQSFNSSWTIDFNAALQAVSTIKQRLEETEVEAENVRGDADSDVGSLVSLVDETRKVLELEGNDGAVSKNCVARCPSPHFTQ